MVNIICMKWGTRYGPEYVNKLYSMVQRHLSLPFRFVCFTDDASDIRAEVECVPIPELEVPAPYHVSPWRKLSMFSDPLHDLSGKTLFLDLDIIIVDAIDPFFTYSDDFTIIENWTQKGQSIGNSSVYCFTAGAHADVLHTYRAHMQQVLKTHDNEQIFLSKQIGQQGKLRFFPDSWCKSFKRHCLPGGILNWIKTPTIPAEAKIIVFHGNPKPEDAEKGIWPGAILKHVRPTPWVRTYWQ